MFNLTVCLLHITIVANVHIYESYYVHFILQFKWDLLYEEVLTIIATLDPEGKSYPITKG